MPDGHADRRLATPRQRRVASIHRPVHEGARVGPDHYVGLAGSRREPLGLGHVGAPARPRQVVIEPD